MDASWMSSRFQSQWHVFVRFAQISGTCVLFIHDLLLMEEILHHLECIKTTVNTAINYQSQQHVIWFKCIYVYTYALSVDETHLNAVKERKIYRRSAWTHCCRERYPEFSGGTFPQTILPTKKVSTAGMGDYNDHLKGICFNQGNKKEAKQLPKSLRFCSCDFANCPKQQLVDSQRWNLMMMYHDPLQEKNGFRFKPLVN